MIPRLASSDALATWDAMAADAVGAAVRRVIAARGGCRLMLTGGTTGARLYEAWAADGTLPAGAVRVLFGDERCVPLDDPESNHGLAMRTLFAGGVPDGWTIEPMRGDWTDRGAAAVDYERHVVEMVDVLLLGMGPDGHVASLFPGGSALRERLRRVVAVTGPKCPYDRLTVTPSVITSAREIFVLATGVEKGRMLRQALALPEGDMSLPVRLALGGTLLLDSDARGEIA